MEKKINFKNKIIQMLKEGDEAFYYLAPDVIGSINNANLDYDKNVFRIDFNTTDGSNMSLNVPYKAYEKWHDENTESEIKDFVISFVKCSKEVKDDDEMLEEIVDEYGDIMPSTDLPSNRSFASVGKSKFGTDKVVKQTVPKSKRYYGDLGLGVVTWLVFIAVILNPVIYF